MITKREEYFEGKSVYGVGGVLAPVLANLFLHHVLDAWFERDVQPRRQGRCVGAGWVTTGSTRKIKIEE